MIPESSSNAESFENLGKKKNPSFTGMDTGVIMSPAADGRTKDDKMEFFAIGAEVDLARLMADGDAEKLLEGFRTICGGYAAVTGGNGDVLFWAGPDGPGMERGKLPEDIYERVKDVRKSGCKGGREEGHWRIVPLHKEGEEAGFLYLSCDGKNEHLLDAIAGIAARCLDILIVSSLRRMLATGLHLAAVNQSYEELKAANEKLAVSEKKYRELAAALEIKVSERTEELRKTHIRLLEQEKMASIGQLAAGIAHEINNPMGFIQSNLSTFSRYTERLEEALSACRKAASGTENGKAAEEACARLKTDFILRDSRELIGQSLEGAKRIAAITGNLKNFSHIDELEDIKLLDVNAEMENTLNILSHQIRESGADIIREYGELPGIRCSKSLCQAFLGVLKNALDSGKKGVTVTIRTRAVRQDKTGGRVFVSISDNGPGIPSGIRERIFEPFFTTKEVGRGTGLGLSVTYQIVSRCGGCIDVESEEGKGASFTISLPLEN